MIVRAAAANALVHVARGEGMLDAAQTFRTCRSTHLRAASWLRADTEHSGRATRSAV